MDDMLADIEVNNLAYKKVSGCNFGYRVVTYISDVCHDVI